MARKNNFYFVKTFSFVIILLSIVYAVITSCDIVPVGQFTDGELLYVTYFDVGQGDSTLIHNSSENINILIDSGDNIKGNNIVKLLKEKDIKTINHLIITHPHADHIGKMDEIINEFSIEKIYMPRLPKGLTPTTRVYEDMLLAIKKKGLKITAPKTGDTIDYSDFKLEFFVPENKSTNINNFSLITYLTYGNTSFLFTGDAEKDVEKTYMSLFKDIDVLKVAHHGSKYATTDKFLKIASPFYSIISNGKDNKYDHPHKEILDRLKKHGSIIYTTENEGTIVVSSDKNKVIVEL